MTRSLIALLLAASGLASSPSAVSAVEHVESRKPSIALSLAPQGMAEVPEAFRVNATSAPKRAVVALQVKVGSRYVTQRTVALDSRGQGKGAVVSTKAAERTYRAVLLSPQRKVIATSRLVTVTWTPLTYSVMLTCARDGAPVRVSIPCSIDVTPRVRLAGVVAVLKVMGRTGWVLIDAWRVPESGRIDTDVEGFEPGTGQYLTQLMRDARVISESPIISIAYSSP